MIPLSYQYDYAWQPNPDNPSININLTRNYQPRALHQIAIIQGIPTFGCEMLIT